MRLLIVGTTGVYPFDESGPALALCALLKGILEVGHLNSDKVTVELLVGISDPKYSDLIRHPLLNVPMVPVLRNLKSIEGFRTTINGCSKFINKVKNADLIFYNSPPTDLITVIYPFVTRLAGKKQIYYLYGSLVNENIDSVARKYFHLIARSGFFDKVLIPLESSKSIVSRLICPYEMITTIPTCVVTPWYEHSKKITLEGDPVLLYAGRLAQVKRVDILLKAFSAIRLYYPSARLYIAGSGPLGPFLKKLGKKLKISEKVVFLGHLRHNKLRRLYRSSDIFILPSDAELMSISLLEAMASRCAVATTDIAATEVVQNHQNGLVSPCGDFKMLANNLSVLADDKALRKKLSDAAYFTVKENFDYKIVSSKLMEEMRNILM